MLKIKRIIDHFPDSWLAKSVTRSGLSAFLVSCLILGGTSQVVMTYKLPLYALSVLVIAYCLIMGIKGDRDNIHRDRIIPIWIGLALAVLTFIYLIPLPPGLWSALPGRDMSVRGFELLGQALPWMPLSLTPELTLLSLFGFLPLIAMALLTLRSNGARIRMALFTLLWMAVVAFVFGIAQIALASGDLYLYEIVNDGFAIGFFSNKNHQGTFFAMVIPIAAYFVVHNDRNDSFTSEFNGPKILGVLALIASGFGILLTASVAAFGLGLFAGFLSVLILSRNSRAKPIIFGIAGLIGVLLIADFVIFGGLVNNLVGDIAGRNDISRYGMWVKTLQAQSTFGFAGIGPGAFADVYLALENRDTLTTIYVPQAHNDYLQIGLEFGWIGYAIILAMVVWCGHQIYKFLFGQKRTRSFKTCLFLSAMIPLLHSVVDYPLRTVSLGALFVLFICIYAKRVDIRQI